METRKIKNNESAFPFISEHLDRNNEKYTKNISGISQRLYIATKVLSGIVSNQEIARKLSEKNIPHKIEIKSLIKAAYSYADELLKQEDEQ